MTQRSFDIVISGAGIAGLTAACAFGAEGASVLIVDPAAPISERDMANADHRSTAFLQPSQRLLDRCGVWAHLSDVAMPLQTMRIVDIAAQAAPKVTAAFDASDISELPFGWNVPNWQIKQALMARLEALPSVVFQSGVALTGVLTRDREVRVTLSDGTRIASPFLIGADGRASPVREALGIGVRTTRFGQKALAFAVTHEVPHEQVSTEVHRSGGPFTLVPLPDRKGQPSSAVVWMENGREALRLSQLDPADFEREMTERSGALYGQLRLASPVALWPVIAQIADSLRGQRTALVAEAAHVVPPIGAQGLNMSLADIETLLDLAPQGLGSAEMLDAFEAARLPEIRQRVNGVSALNRASMAGSDIARNLRAEMLKLLHGVAPVRKTLMRKGLGA